MKIKSEYTVCLAGNPNTGKSSIFNALTGLKQHTGNWSGKTVSNATGYFKVHDETFKIIDVPGTYSLFGFSEDEIVARDFICFNESDAVIVVTDATALERNINLVLQVLEYNKNIVMVVNLMDEANKKEICINKLKLFFYLGIPIVYTSARKNEGLDNLKTTIHKLVNKELKYQPVCIKYNDELENKIQTIENKLENYLWSKRTFAIRILDSNDSFIKSLKENSSNTIYNEFQKHNIPSEEKINIRDNMISENYLFAEDVIKHSVSKKNDTTLFDQKIDGVLTSKLFGIPIMISLLALVFYLTIVFANYPSEIIANFLNGIENHLLNFANYLNINPFIRDFLILGVYKTSAWVTAVMLPPMAIFFPMFTLLEDLGYLPRVAYNLDRCFKKSCAHGKQCLSMCMGLGCNAAGVTGARIIDSPRERLIAILTNTFVPCNGRFPTIIVLSTTFFAITTNSAFNKIIPAIAVTCLVCLGIIVTLLVSLLLSKTILKGKSSSFTLELPPYRIPNVGHVLYTSLINRTIFLLGRAIKVAAPFGGLIYLLANIFINDINILTHLANFLSPLGNIMGLDGVILLAFILAIPANEIFIPIVIMIYLQNGFLADFESISSLKSLLISNGWGLKTCVCVLIFSLLHWPCSTTLLTIKKETASWKYTLLSFLLPTSIALISCIIINLII